MLVYILLYMLGQQLNMGTSYWVMFAVCIVLRIVSGIMKLLED